MKKSEYASKMGLCEEAIDGWEETKPDLWEFLEQDAPHAEHTKHLFQWSLNYDHGHRPFDLFLDLIGYSEEQYGNNLHSGDYGSTIGYVEADYLADALKEWADHPQRVEAWVSSLMECEG